jgi:hypothetical protein
VARRAPLALKRVAGPADQHGMVIVLRLFLAMWICLAAMGVLMYLPR